MAYRSKVEQLQRIVELQEKLIEALLDRYGDLGERMPDGLIRILGGDLDDYTLDEPEGIKAAPLRVTCPECLCEHTIAEEAVAEALDPDGDSKPTLEAIYLRATLDDTVEEALRDLEAEKLRQYLNPIEAAPALRRAS